MNSLLPAILVFVAIAFVTIAGAVGWEMLRETRQRRKAVKQLQSLDEDLFGEEVRTQEELLRRGAGRNLGWMGGIAAVPQIAELEALMERGDVTMSIPTFTYLTLGLGLGGGLTAFIATHSLLIAAVAAGFMAPTPYLYVRFRKWRRSNRFESQFPEAIDLMGRAIRAGHPLSAGVRMVAEEMPDPTGVEFRKVFEEQRFGLPFNDALLAMADRNDLVDVRIFCTAVLIQREVGGNLAEILDKLATMIRMRFAIRRQLRTYTAQGRMSGYVLAAVPFGVGFMIYILNPGYMKLLFTEPAGRYMILGAVILQLIGFLWIRKIVNIEI